jgi:hypothetical protein
MLKRHEVQVLLKAGHGPVEASRLAGVSVSSVKRIADEAPVSEVEDAGERAKRGIGRPSRVERFRGVVKGGRHLPQRGRTPRTAPGLPRGSREWLSVTQRPVVAQRAVSRLAS